MSITYADVTAAHARTQHHIRPVVLSAPETADGHGGPQLCFAYEFLQHTGTFKARGAANFVAAHADAGTLPPAGVVIASGGNAGLACAWAARRYDTQATVFLPRTAPAVKVARLHALGARVEQVGTEYAEALEASRKFAAEAGALQGHAYDLPLVAAGAGTLLEEIHAGWPAVRTVVVAVGGGGLFAGVTAAAHEHGIRVVAVEPRECRALNAALAAGTPVDVPVESVAADSLGARRVTPMALDWAQRADAVSVLVSDDAITGARQALWDERRVAVEHGTAAAYAALRTGVYAPEPGEQVCVVLCGANTDPGDLTGSSTPAGEPAGP